MAEDELEVTEVNEGGELAGEEQPAEAQAAADPQVEAELQQLESVSGLQLEAEDREKLHRLIETVRAMNPTERQVAYRQFWRDNPQILELVAQLREFEALAQTAEKPAQLQPEGVVPDENASEEQPAEVAKETERREEDLNEAQEQLQESLAKVLAQKIITITQAGEWNDDVAQAVRTELQGAGLPGGEIDTLLAQVEGLRESLTAETLEALLRPVVERHEEAVVETMADTGEYQEIMSRLKELPEDDPSRRDLVNAASKAAEEMMDQIPMDSIIDLIFATGHGGFGRHGRYDRWSQGEESEENKRHTLEALREIFDSQEAARLFFSELTDVSSEDAYENLLGRLDSVFGELEGGDADKKNEVRKLFSKAVEKASNAPDVDVSLEPEQVSFSKDVLKLVLLMAKKHSEMGKK